MPILESSDYLDAPENDRDRGGTGKAPESRVWVVCPKCIGVRCGYCHENGGWWQLGSGAQEFTPKAPESPEARPSNRYARDQIRGIADEYDQEPDRAIVAELTKRVKPQPEAAKDMPCPCKGCYSDADCQLKPHILPPTSQPQQNAGELELRDTISALRRQRDAHQMDENEYVDAVVATIAREKLAAVELFAERVKAKAEYVELGEFKQYHDFTVSTGTIDELLDQFKEENSK